MACLLLEAHRFEKDTTEAPFRNATDAKLQEWLEAHRELRDDIQMRLAKGENPPEDVPSRWSF